MTNNKWKIIANDQFLGHYHSTSPLGAIKRAIEENRKYRPEILDLNCTFVANKGSFHVSTDWTALEQAGVKHEG